MQQLTGQGGVARARGMCLGLGFHVYGARVGVGYTLLPVVVPMAAAVAVVA